MCATGPVCGAGPGREPPEGQTPLPGTAAVWRRVRFEQVWGAQGRDGSVPALPRLLENVPLNGTVWGIHPRMWGAGETLGKNVKKKALAEKWISGSGESSGVFVSF